MTKYMGKVFSYNIFAPDIPPTEQSCFAGFQFLCFVLFFFFGCLLFCFFKEYKHLCSGETSGMKKKVKQLEKIYTPKGDFKT